ncbi:hypothetical protein QTJ16_004502 [Diplocarpon rosae]|uniref:N-acetyltransferase ESCO acetyl-transferase domain-containing protein n=1 Tax=Diplocarpon rosae TaxID=946125 RepID=A0AAD9T0Y4_9HELO|nr:hypothetical protein QTJ16_004502 [Diplocarpon rosae]
MTTSLGSSTGRALRTYSRRNNSTTSAQPPDKRKRSNQSQSLPDLPPTKKFARSSIQSYFQPLSSSSCLATTRASQNSSDELNPRSTPPSSPPPMAVESVFESQRHLKKPKRRLTTRPPINPANTISDQRCGFCMDEGAFKCTSPGSAKRKPEISKQFMSDDGYVDPEEQEEEEEEEEEEISNYSPSSHTITRAVNTGPATKKSSNPVMSQTRLASKSMTRTCRECGTLYDPSIASDVAAHNKEHDHQVNCSAGNINLKQYTPIRYIQLVGSGSTAHVLSFCIISNSCEEKVRKFAEMVVKQKIDQTMNCAHDDLWVHIHDPSNPDQLTPKYKVCIALLGKLPIGALVVKAFGMGQFYSRKAHWETHDQNFALLDPLVQKCEMTVDKIWVERKYRGAYDFEGSELHIAHDLLDLARHEFFGSYVVPKNKIAFSPVTNDGYKCAVNFYNGTWLTADGKNIEKILLAPY